MPGQIHLHTAASDGHITPQMVLDAKLDFVSATDHDTLAGYDFLEPLKLKGVEVIPGIELSARWSDRKFHVVVIDVQPSPGFDSIIDRLTAQRRDRYEFTLGHLQEKGFSIRCLEKNPESPPYKHEIARSMISDPDNARQMEQHAVRDARDFRKRYLKSGPTRITMKGVAMEDIVKNIGGIFILAHPGEKFELPHEIPMVEELLRNFNFHGIEVKTRKHNRDEERHSLELAKKFNLVPVTSNDVHERGHLNRNMTPRDQLDKLRARL